MNLAFSSANNVYKSNSSDERWAQIRITNQIQFQRNYQIDSTKRQN